jgi:hypothetical protein
METFLDVPDEYLTALGAISANMSLLELGLELCISLLISRTEDDEDKKEMLCLVGAETFETLLSKLDKLYRYKVKDQSQLTEFDEIYRRLDHIGKMRIKYVHSMLNKEEDKVIRFKFKRSMSNDGTLHETDEVLLADLQNLIKSIVTINQELYTLILSHLPQIQREHAEHLRQLKSQTSGGS